MFFEKGAQVYINVEKIIAESALRKREINMLLNVRDIPFTIVDVSKKWNGDMQFKLDTSIMNNMWVNFKKDDLLPVINSLTFL